MRKSIALLLTLVFIAITVSLTGIILVFYDKITKSDTFRIIGENSLLLRSLKSEMSKVNLKTDKDVENLLKYDFYVETKNFKLQVSFKALNNKLNINKFLEKNGKINDAFNDVMDNLCTFYELKECEYLKSLIADSIDKDNNERSDGSEIKNYMPFKDGAIYNLNEMRLINKFYYMHTKDKNIFQVKWEKFFNTSGTYLDCNILSSDVLRLLGAEEKAKCKDFKYLYSISFLKNLDIIPFDKKRSFPVIITLKYFLDTEHDLNITYDVTKKRIIGIEEHIIY